MGRLDVSFPGGPRLPFEVRRHFKRTEAVRITLDGSPDVSLAAVSRGPVCAVNQAEMGWLWTSAFDHSRNSKIYFWLFANFPAPSVPNVNRPDFGTGGGCSTDRPTIGPNFLRKSTTLNQPLVTVVVGLAKALPIGPVPEQVLIALMRDDVVHCEDWRPPAFLGAHYAKRIVALECCCGHVPSARIATPASAAATPIVLPLGLSLLHRRPQLRCSYRGNRAALRSSRGPAS